MDKLQSQLLCPLDGDVPLHSEAVDGVQLFLTSLHHLLQFQRLATLRTPHLVLREWHLRDPLRTMASSCSLSLSASGATRVGASCERSYPHRACSERSYPHRLRLHMIRPARSSISRIHVVSSCSSSRRGESERSYPRQLSVRERSYPRQRRLRERSYPRLCTRHRERSYPRQRGLLRERSYPRRRSVCGARGATRCSARSRHDVHHGWRRSERSYPRQLRFLAGPHVVCALHLPEQSSKGG